MVDTTKTPGHFRLAGKEFPEVTWYRLPHLRNTYLLLFFVILTSATNGYDGSMVNGLLSLDQFTDCKKYRTISVDRSLTSIRYARP